MRRTPLMRGKWKRSDGDALIAARGLRRRDLIVGSSPAAFLVSENPRAIAYPAPWYSRRSQQLVTRHSMEIELAASCHDLDPEYLRAIIWMESTHGWYDGLTQLIKRPKTILPMNIYAEYWKGLGISRSDLQSARINIDTGAYLVSQLTKRIDSPNLAKVATLYNRLGLDRVSGYGMTVLHYYQSRPWDQV